MVEEHLVVMMAGQVEDLWMDGHPALVLQEWGLVPHVLALQGLPVAGRAFAPHHAPIQAHIQWWRALLVEMPHLYMMKIRIKYYGLIFLYIWNMIVF